MRMVLSASCPSWPPPRPFAASPTSGLLPIAAGMWLVDRLGPGTHLILLAHAFLPSPQTRFPANAAASGSSSPLWYSQNVGPMHIAFVTSYAPYDQSSAQYTWLESDLANVNRTETPWLIVVFHAPWYTSYKSHYMEANCHRLDTETLLYENGVDLVFNGHVHAYERTFPVYNFTLNECGPVHITVGDGGNVEKLAAVFADLPGNCPSVTEYGPSYQPEACPQYLYDGKYCASSQPFWSAYRRVCAPAVSRGKLGDGGRAGSCPRSMVPSTLARERAVPSWTCIFACCPATWSTGGPPNLQPNTHPITFKQTGSPPLATRRWRSTTPRTPTLSGSATRTA